MNPLIAIPTATLPSALPTEPSIWAMRSSYVQAIMRAGGLPVLLPPLVDRTMLHDLLARVDGIMLAGGADIDPTLYGEKPEPGLEQLDPGRDQIERAVTEWALAHQMPVLGICRGMQMINIALGGTLYQDLPKDGPVPHRIDPITYESLTKNGHELLVEPSSIFARLVGDQSSTWVNSMHHQAVKQLGSNLRTSAWTSDMIPEVIEYTGLDNWLVGVQGHPEAMTTESWSYQLFETFIGQTKTFQRDRS